MPDQEQRPEDLRIPLHVEEVSVSRREVEKANVQIALITGTREQLVDKELTHVRVEIERVPIGRTIEVVPSISQEGDTTIIPVVEEIVAVERRLVLKEEVRIRRVTTKEQPRGHPVPTATRLGKAFGVACSEASRTTTPPSTTAVLKAARRW